MPLSTVGSVVIQPAGSGSVLGDGCYVPLMTVSGCPVVASLLLALCVKATATETTYIALLSLGLSACEYPTVITRTDNLQSDTCVDDSVS